MTANPLVASRVTMTTPLSGTFLLEDCEAIGSGIRNGDWLEGGMGAFGAVADGVAMAVDPLGSVLAMGFGWLIDHMWPIKDWFNDLTGDAGEVAAFAATWDNIAGHMQGVSDELTRILADLDDQHGQFFDTYRQFQGESAAHAAAAGRLASAMGVGMQIASTIVKIVHDMTRDALTQLAGTAISAATTAAITIGFGTPWAVAQVATRVSALSARIGKYVTKLVRAIKELLPRLEDAARLFRSLRKALDEALESGKGALRTAVRKGDDISAPHAGGLDEHGSRRTAPEGDFGGPDSPIGWADPDLPRHADPPTYNNADGKVYGTRTWDDTVQNLPAEERRAIKDYTRDPGDAHAPGDLDYRDINTALRTGEGLEDPHLAQTIDSIQHALERTRTPEDLTVVRGMDLQNQDWFPTSSVADLPGRTIPNPTFTSTTLGDTLPPFANLQNMDSILHLDVPKGTPAMFLDSISLHPGESELLLGKGLDMQIISAAQDAAGKWHIHATIAAP